MRFLRSNDRFLLSLWWKFVVVAIAITLAMFGLGAIAVADTGGDPIIGDWNVTYGAPAVVTMSGSSAGYTVTAKTPVRVTGSSCDLPPGTLIATFSGSGNAYSGQHGLWYTSDCSFGFWDPMTLTLDGITLTAVLSGGYGTVTFTKSGGPCQIAPLLSPGTSGTEISGQGLVFANPTFSNPQGGTAMLALAWNGSRLPIPPNGSALYQLSIGWGDSSSASDGGTISILPGGSGSYGCVNLQHRYSFAGHYPIAITLTNGSLPDALVVQGIGSVYPSLLGPPDNYVGVLTNNGGGAQCTATVVGSITVGKQTRATSGNTIVTAKHCLVPSSNPGYVFAPGHEGVSPLFTSDYTTRTVSHVEGSYGGSPYQGQSIGPAPYGLWPVAPTRNVNTGPCFSCPLFSTAPAVYVDDADDIAFLDVSPPEQYKGRTLTSLVGGANLDFTPGSPSLGTTTAEIGYDVVWIDSLMSQFETASEPPSFGCNNQTATCAYEYPTGAVGQHTCVGAFAGPSTFTDRDNRVFKVSVFNGCNLYTFASGAPIIQNGRLVGVEHGSNGCQSGYRAATPSYRDMGTSGQKGFCISAYNPLYGASSPGEPFRQFVRAINSGPLINGA